jgi:nicotinamidase-related amidase
LDDAAPQGSVVGKTSAAGGQVPDQAASQAASSTQLVVVDMQNVFGQDGSDWRSPRFDEIVSPVAALVAAYSPNVVFTRFISPVEPSGAWVAYYADWPFALQAPEHPMWDVVEPLAGLASQVDGVGPGGGTVDKPTFSKWGPELKGLLGPRGRMVLVGVSTDCCVISTALAAADDGVEVLVVPEACAGVDDPSHDQALHVMSLYGPLIKLTPLSEALALAGEPPAG